VRTVTQPDIDAVVENYYCIQIIEIGFPEYFNASRRMRPKHVLIKLTA
jgi:hypothetical protein